MGDSTANGKARSHRRPPEGVEPVTRKKGGGRESGASGDTEAVRAAETGRAAANPAARPYHATHTCDETEDRIRELEARVRPSYDGLPEDYGIRSNGPRRNATETVAAADPAD